MQRDKAGHGGVDRAESDRVNAALVRPLIADALARLSAEHRAVIRRSYYLGWTTAQIAHDLHIGEFTVKSRLHFALRALRLALQRQLTCCALNSPGPQHQPDGVQPSPQGLLAAASDVGRRGVGSHSPGASRIGER
jgi:hypothetical protein